VQQDITLNNACNIAVYHLKEQTLLL